MDSAVCSHQDGKGGTQRHDPPTAASGAPPKRGKRQNGNHKTGKPDGKREPWERQQWNSFAVGALGAHGENVLAIKVSYGTGLRQGKVP